MIGILLTVMLVYQEITLGSCNVLPEPRCHPATGRCYWMDPSTYQTWAEARESCKTAGGDLAVMETQELWDFVTSQFTRENEL